MTCSTTNAQDWLYDVTPVIQPSFTRHYSKAMQRNPYLSPALAPADDGHFARLAKAGVTVAVDSGTDEILHDEICALVDNMRNQGLKVDFTKVGTEANPSLRTDSWGYAWRVHCRVPSLQALARDGVLLADSNGRVQGNI